jgi:hypothetical protein
MTSRLLPPEEWDRLRGTEADAVIPHLAALHAEALVVEQDGAIVGCWLFLPIWHAECLWIAPTHRGKSGVARQLLRGLHAFMARLKVTRLWTGCASDDVRRLLTHYGATAIPGDHFVMTMGDR